VIARGQPLYAVLREDEATGILEVLACGQNAGFAEGKMDDYRYTSSRKRRKVTLVRLAVEAVIEEYREQGVRE
jgi:hypothetical protein